MDVKNTHSATKTEISVFGRQALDAERRRSPSLADKVLILPGLQLIIVLTCAEEQTKTMLCRLFHGTHYESFKSAYYVASFR